MNRPRGRSAMEPRSPAGVIGINMPRRSVEDVAFTDGPSCNVPLPTEETDDSGAAARESHVARNGLRPAANDPNVRRSQMRFLCLKVIWVCGFRSSVQRSK